MLCRSQTAGWFAYGSRLSMPLDAYDITALYDVHASALLRYCDWTVDEPDESESG